MLTIQADLKSNKDVLSALKEGMAENISIMQKNLRQMDLKVSALENLQWAVKRLPARRLQYSYHAGVWALIIIGFGFEARERF